MALNTKDGMRREGLMNLRTDSTRTLLLMCPVERNPLRQRLELKPAEEEPSFCREEFTRGGTRPVGKRYFGRFPT